MISKELKRKTLTSILCFAVIFTSINITAFEPVYATAAGTYTSLTWNQVGNSGLASVSGYYPGTTGTACTQYVQAAVNQKYGMSISYPGGYVSSQRSWLQSYAVYTFV